MCICRCLLMSLLLATAIHAHSLPSRRPTPGGAQESSNLTYHSSATEVRLVFFVTDEHNRPAEVRGLKRNKFCRGR